MTAEARDGSQQHRLNTLPLTYLARDIAGNARIGRLLHENESFTHAIFRKNIQVWRLSELNRQRLFQVYVANPGDNPVHENGQKNLVLVGEPRTLAKVEKV